MSSALVLALRRALCMGSVPLLAAAESGMSPPDCRWVSRQISLRLPKPFQGQNGVQRCGSVKIPATWDPSLRDFQAWEIPTDGMEPNNILQVRKWSLKYLPSFLEASLTHGPESKAMSQPRGFLFKSPKKQEITLLVKLHHWGENQCDCSSCCELQFFSTAADFEINEIK